MIVARTSLCFQKEISADAFPLDGIIAGYWLFYSQLLKRVVGERWVWNGVAFSFTRSRVGFCGVLSGG